MEFFEEMLKGMDLRRPRVIVTDEIAVLENVAGIVMLSETAVTVLHGLTGPAAKPVSRLGRPVFTTITGTGLIIREISEGRLLIGGNIQRAEFFQSPDSH